jgi:hypothetical protein
MPAAHWRGDSNESELKNELSPKIELEEALRSESTDSRCAPRFLTITKRSDPSGSQRHLLATLSA